MSEFREESIKTANIMANSIAEEITLENGWSIVDGYEGWMIRHPDGYTHDYWDKECSDFFESLKQGLYYDFACKVQDYNKRTFLKENLKFIGDNLI